MHWTLDDLLGLDTDTYLELVRWANDLHEE